MSMANITQEEWEAFQEKYEKLRENEELYRVALSLTDHTVTVVDVAERTLNQIYNEGDWTGVASSMPDAPESIIATGIIHPEDQEGYRQFFRDIYAGVPEGEFTMRVMGEQRGWVWFTMYYKTIFGEDGTPIKAISFSDDITARKKAEQMYDQYREAVTHDSDYIWEVDLDEDALISEDSAGDELFSQSGFKKFSDIAAVAFTTVPEEYRDKVAQTFSIDHLLEEFGNAKREVTLEYPFQPASGGDMMWMQSTAYMTTTPAGHVNAIICVRDITNRKTEEERLRKAAERDSLCGLLNRRAFEQRVADQLSNDRRMRGGFLFMIDIDDFKTINDQFGHLFGDEILKAVGTSLREHFRTVDIIGRVGGDEFMIFVPNIDAGQAGGRADIVERDMRTKTFSQDMDRSVTLSIGIAEAELTDDFDALYTKADKALYEAKAGGKGCWRLYSEQAAPVGSMN